MSSTYQQPTATLETMAQKRILEELSKHIHLESCRSTFAIGGTVPITSTLATGLICESDGSISDVEIGNEHESGCQCPSVKANDTLGTSYDGEGDDRDDDQYDWDRDEEEKHDREAYREWKKRDAVNTATRELLTHHKMRCDPITLRWDSRQEATSSPSGHKLTLPCDDSSGPAFEQLLHDCQPASFGRGGVDVMDESYRKAGKMDEQDFCSNFNPYAIGIVDAVAQALLPNQGKVTNETRGLRAELYKLNVYSSPSGRFRPHVDTPRSKHQVGTLVVCLPSVHEGGQLVLRHQGRETLFDWSGEKGLNIIQWAAFYSDCEHEVLEVTAGHRLTLTYNLYATCHANAARVDAENMELCKTLTALIEQPAFCREGLILGYHCSHVYPHTNESIVNTLPAALKGVDKLVYDCFAATGLQLNVRQALDYNLERKAKKHFHHVVGPRSRAAGGDGPWRGLREMYSLAQTAEGPCLFMKPQPDDGAKLAILSNKLVPVELTDEGMYDGAEDSSIIEAWTKDFEVARVRWLNGQGDKQMALVHGAYGNEASLDTRYCSLVMTLRIPAFHER